MIRAVFALAVTALSGVAGAASHAEVAPAPRLPFMRGMNFCGYYGDYLENSTSTDTPTSAQRYADLKAKGFDHVRLPIDFRKYSDFNSSTGVATLKESTTTSTWWGGTTTGPGFATFDQILDLAEDAGLYVVVDFHGWFDIDTTNDLQRAQFKACWAAVAERYKDRSNKVVFELANEPRVNNGKTIAALNTLQKETVAIIRETNPTRLILYAVADANQPWALTMAQNPPNFGWVSVPANDNNLALVIHCYNPGVFTHQGCTWANPSYTNQVRLTNSHRTTLNWDLNQVKIYMDSHDIPIVMNEFNVAHQIADHGDVTEYLSMVTRWCESNNVPWAPWLYFGSGNDEMNVRNQRTGWNDFVMDGLFPDLTTTDNFRTNDYAQAIDIIFSGYAGASALANFPVLVKLSEDIPGFHYADFSKPGGGDLRFTDADGNLVPHEIDTWNTNGVSAVWVKVPSLSAATTIRAHYGCAKPCVPKVESVWDADYVGVWHLGEDALPHADSSNVSRDFTAADGAGIGYGATGVVGGAVDFGETGNARGLFTDDHALLDGFAQFTVEAWTYQTRHVQDTGILSKRQGYGNDVSYYLYDTGADSTLQVSSNGTSVVAADVASAPALGQWNHQVFTSDGAVHAGSGELCLGNFQSGDARNFPGKIDEVRISKCIRSADWIQATHDTVANARFAVYSVRGVDVAWPPESDPASSTVSDAEGYDFTNRTIAVSGATAGAEVTLAISGSDGTSGTVTAVADANGEADFNWTTVPGAGYTYSVGEGVVTLGAGGFLAGNWGADGSLFAAMPDGQGGSTETNGFWALPPEETNATRYVVGDAVAFTTADDARTEANGKLVRVDTTVEYTSFCDGASEIPLPEPDASFAGMTAVTNAGGASEWWAWIGGTWRSMYGAAPPRLGTPYVLRMESDFSSAFPRVRFSVSSDGGASFSLLSDASGDSWLGASGTNRRTVSGVLAGGDGLVAAVKGAVADASVASAGGTNYASVAEAMSGGGAVALLTNATMPTNAPVGTSVIERRGYSLLLPHDGVAVDGNAVIVSAGVSVIDGVGRLNVNFAGLAGVGVETAGRSPTQIAAALKEVGANGLARWQSYVLGLDAADPAARPRAEIAVDSLAEEALLSLGGVIVSGTTGASVSFRVYEVKDLSDPSKDVAVGSEAAPGETVSVDMERTGTKLFRIRVRIEIPR